MTSLLITIHESLDAAAAGSAFVPAICPYLSALGAEAKLLSVRQFREVRAGEDSARVGAVELTLSGPAEPELAGTLVRLERFLRQLAKDTESAATFHIHVLKEGTEDA
jgi:hypothetical protein